MMEGRLSTPHSMARAFPLILVSLDLPSTTENLSTLYEVHKPAVSVLRLTPIIFGARTLDE